MTFYEKEVNRLRDILYPNKEQLDMAIQTKNYIEDNYSEDLSLFLLSNSMFVSKFHLLRLFKKHYGVTPRQYLIDTRIKKSKEHLKTGMTATDACYTVGFRSLGSFSSLFKLKVGDTPAEYRKKQLSRNNLHGND